MQGLSPGSTRDRVLLPRRTQEATQQVQALREAEATGHSQTGYCRARQAEPDTEIFKREIIIMKATLIIVWMITGTGTNDGVDLEMEKVVGLSFGACLELKGGINKTQGIIERPPGAKYSARAYCVPHR